MNESTNLLVEKTKKYLKKFNVLYVPLRALHGSLGYFFRIIRIKKTIKYYDSKLPLAGVMENDGWHQLNLSNANTLNLTALHNINTPLHLCKKFHEPIIEIFDKISKHISDYLGSGACLDGLYWMVTSAENAKTQLSSNWHTDNVGNRIKVFVCIDGDGSQPTAIIPGGHKALLTIFSRNYLYETWRWAGFEMKKKLKKEIHLRHRKGSIFLFDTNNFHRGVYEATVSKRVVLVIEFSDNEKSQKINGPIGTKHYNKFTFSSDINNISSFNKFLDLDRVTKAINDMYIYG